MRLVVKSKSFARFQKKAGLADDDLVKAVDSAENGLIDADLGGGVIKQRIATAGRGKSGGSRTIILFRHGARAVFVYGFEKKDRANIQAYELEAFRELASVVLDYSETEMLKRVKDGAFIRVIPKGKEDNNAQ